MKLAFPVDEVARKAWRAYARVAEPPLNGKPGYNYSPRALILIRWLDIRPGGSTADIACAHELSPSSVRHTLNRLRTLGVTDRDPETGWKLTEVGRWLRVLIDEEGVV